MRRRVNKKSLWNTSQVLSLVHFDSVPFVDQNRSNKIEISAGEDWQYVVTEDSRFGNGALNLYPYRGTNTFHNWLAVRLDESPMFTVAGALTYSFWIKLRSDKRYPSEFVNGYDVTSSFRINCNIDLNKDTFYAQLMFNIPHSAGHLRVYKSYTGGPWNTDVRIGKNMFDNAWHHIYITKQANSSQICFYQDGNLIYTDTNWRETLPAWNNIVIMDNTQAMIIDELFVMRQGIGGPGISQVEVPDAPYKL